MEPKSAIANPEQMILDKALLSLKKGEAQIIAGVDSLGMSERCVEVPWAAALLRDSSSVLDIGFSMSPPEWMGVLLRLAESGSRLVGIDIIDPNRVKSRYRADQVSAVLQIPVRVADFLTALSEEELFDTVACISTLEHIGIDRATDPSNTATVFERSESVSFFAWADPNFSTCWIGWGNFASRLTRLRHTPI